MSVRFAMVAFQMLTWNFCRESPTVIQTDLLAEVIFSMADMNSSQTRPTPRKHQRRPRK